MAILAHVSSQVFVPVTLQLSVHDVMVAQFIEVAVATHNTGVTRVGLVSITNLLPVQV